MTSIPAAELQLTTERSDQTEHLGEVLGAWLQPGDVVLLHGDLGAGKTTLTKGIARALGVQDTVSSPSFALVNEYALPLLRLFHLDLYRLDDPADLESIGFAELTAAEDGIAIVEWPERAGVLLPDRYLLVEIVYAGEGRRDVRISGAPAAAWMERLLALHRALTSFQPA
ncbi:MAG: tRNA (adenosine(37)-N6)-threonylcarbamoyltransferase complex ATPase subunit type 1 TsaE [Chloroflexota bacterium]|nr:tRNA (adenosine(37)-N6)-threonylcarbamoyltransferase complex ATPase subunit type 1 TsaE [Chloroflexota bacterium]